ncbi:MAG TPA: nucleotide exchange factor GrpE [Candidatus Polarisedimenticolia bacterium]|jgi:molecular chaperone GrpE|nr:nucleotide exchange factor GrpE [Candidatus Polarisedimenticolia bacterium]
MDELKNSKNSAEAIPVRVTDRRPRFDGTPAPESESPAPSSRHPSLVVELEERARKAESKLAEALNLLRRREAEAEDFRVRLRKEMERRARAEMETWMKAMLEVMDSLDRGVASAAGESDADALREGMLKVREQGLAILARQGVEPMSLAGSLYDPHLAEAVALTEAATPEEENHVVEDIQTGYTFGGQVLRPAQVRVARTESDTLSDAEEDRAPDPD